MRSEFQKIGNTILKSIKMDSEMVRIPHKEIEFMRFPRPIISKLEKH